MGDFINFNIKTTAPLNIPARLVPVILSFLIIICIYNHRDVLRHNPYISRILRHVLRLIITTSFFIEYPLRYLQTGISKDILPLHLCSLGAICALILLVTHNQKLFSFLCCGCFPGAFAAMLFPAINRSYDHIQYYSFMLLHMSILVTTAYYYIIFSYRVSVRSFILIVLCLQLISFFIGAANDYFDTSYWYLSYKRPLLSNGVFSLLGNGITYFLRFDLMALLMFFVWGILYFHLDSQYKKHS